LPNHDAARLNSAIDPGPAACQPSFLPVPSGPTGNGVTNGTRSGSWPSGTSARPS